MYLLSPRTFSVFFLGFALFCGPFLRSEEETTAPVDKHPSVVGSRALSASARNDRFFTQEEKEGRQASQGPGFFPSADPQKKFSPKEFRAWHESFPIDYVACGLEVHTLIGWRSSGDVLSIEDGSTFVVTPSDRWCAACWVPGDIVYLTPNHGYFFGLFPSSYDFCFYNPRTRDSVEVSLSMGPYYFDPSVSHWVTTIDRYNGMIALQDGTLFLVDPSDRSYLSEWATHDHVIVGSNDGRHRDTYPHILINVATVTYLRGTFVY